MFCRRMIAALSLAGASLLANAAPAAAESYQLLEFSNPGVGQEAAFANWLAGTHMRQMLRVPGVVSAQRFSLSAIQNRPRQSGVDPAIPPPALDLVIYNIDTADIAAFTADLKSRLSKGTVTPLVSGGAHDSFTYTFRELGPPVPGLAPPAPHADSGPAKTYELLVFANAKPGRDADFNTEYDTQHAPNVARRPGFVSWQRLVLDAVQMGDTPVNEYLATYVISAPNIAAVYEAARPRPKPGQTRPSLPPGSAFDNSNDYSETYEAVGPLVRAANTTR